MSEKYLTEKDWKSFCKNPAWKADALLKGFAALEKAEKSGPADQIKALDEISRQADVLQKANKADKILANYLGEVEKAAAKVMKESRKALEAAKAKAGDDEEEDGPPNALLDPKKLLAQLNLCKRDPDRVVQFGFTDARGDQEAAFALSHKVDGRKLFAKLQTATGSKTGAYGSAWVDGAQLMLQLDKPLGGLVKKVREPVKACGFKVSKVVLWNDDGNIFEQDEELEAPGDARGDPKADPKADPKQEAQAKVPDPLRESFDMRLAELARRSAEAIKAQHPETIKLRALEAFAREKAAGANHKAALSALDSLEKLLGVPVPVAAGGQVDYAKCRLAWEAARKKVHAELQKLEKAILDEYRGTKAFDEIAAKLRKLDTVLVAFSEDLSDTLDQALNATDPAVRKRLHGEAATLIRRFQAHAENDAFITQLESNPFVPIDTRGTLVKTLTALSRMIA